MENSVNNCVRQRVFSKNHQIKTMINKEEDQEESSWVIYFDDDEMVDDDTEDHYYDNDSSMISDAASPIHTTKITRKANNIHTNPKKRRIIHQHKEEEQQQHHDKGEEEEDTASSPSNKTKGFSVLDGAEDNGKSMNNNITSEKRGCITDTGSKIDEIMNEEFSAELKKRGLCVVPLSMLSNFKFIA